MKLLLKISHLKVKNGGGRNERKDYRNRPWNK